MKNLKGKTLLLTRAAEDNASWAAYIRQRGGRTKSLPCIKTEPVNDPDTALRLKEALACSDWLVLTSRRGVAAVEELYSGPLPASIRIAAVGPVTAAEAVTRWGRCDLTGGTGTGIGLAKDLAAVLTRNGLAKGARIVAATAEGAVHHLEEVLEPLGFSITRIAVYRTLPITPMEGKHDLSRWGLDAILLASPSAARGLKNLADLPSNINIISIGPATTRAALSLGIEVTAEAGHPSLEAILEVLL